MTVSLTLDKANKLKTVVTQFLSCKRVTTSFMLFLHLAFSLVLQKIQKEHSDEIVVVLRWPTQTWWPVAMKMLAKASVVLPANERTLYLPIPPNEKRPPHQKLSLRMCHLSGNNFKTFRGLSSTFINIMEACILAIRYPTAILRAPYQNGSYTVVKGS